MAFIPLERLSAMHEGYKKAFKIEKLNVLLIQPQGKPYLIENKCPHMDVALDTGQLLPDSKIRCRAHGIEFDIVSGKACGPLADTLACLKHIKIVYEGNQLGVNID